MYVIYFSGFFCHGYVRHQFWGRRKIKDIPFDTEKEVLDFATKFRFKMVADLYCRMYNYIARKNFELRTFSVKKLPQ